MADQHPGGEPFRLPDLGEGLAEAEIIEWHVQPGDRVVADQPLVTVETDKAVVDIPAPRSGRVASISVAVGETAAVGEILLVFAGEGDSPAPTSTTVVGQLPETPSTASVAPPQQVTEQTSARVRAAPSARRRAAELGVALEDVRPSGPGGIVQVADVEAASGDTGLERVRGVRAAMAARMAAAHAQVARSTVTGEADISGWRNTAEVMPRLVRAIVAASTAQPRLNAHFDAEAMTLRLHDRVDLGVAMETPDGLLVPVLREADALTSAELAQALTSLRERALQRALTPEELRGQTISLSNFGAVGGRYAEMIVVPPQVAIVGAGRIHRQLKLVDGAPREIPVLPLSISFDHRVITGVEACAFLGALTDDLQRAD